MTVLNTILTIVFIILSIVITVIILMQEGKSAGLGAIAGDDVWLMETTASTVALIVNELIQNSLKYAFKDRKQRTQIIELVKNMNLTAKKYYKGNR